MKKSDFYVVFSDLMKKDTYKLVVRCFHKSDNKAFLDATAPRKTWESSEHHKIFGLQDRPSAPENIFYIYQIISTPTPKSAKMSPFRTVSASFSDFIISLNCFLCYSN